MVNSIVFDPTLWKRNRQALERREPELTRRLDLTPLPTRLIAAPADDGSPVLGVVMDDGQSVALCHTKQPLREADQWALNLGEETRRSPLVLLLGFGAGYHPISLFRRINAESWICIVEPDAALMKAALHLNDYSALIESPRVRFIVGMSEKETASLLLTGLLGNRMRAHGARMAFTGVSRQLYADYIQRLSAAIKEAIQMEGLKLRTSETQGEAILRNIAGNLPYILRGAPWKRLLGAAPGVPALVIAPGPSLEESLPLLSSVRSRAIFFAVDTSHRILHRRGIVSDFVVSLDFTELNARHFDPIQQDSAALVAFPGVHPSISARYVGRTFFYDHSGSADYGPGATQLVKSLESLGGLGTLISYGSTAHIAVHAASAMGCSPIILIGNDLSFPNSRWYAAGAMQNEISQPERETEPLLTVATNDGKTVQTSGLYKYYLDTFADLIRGVAAPVTNASLHGARIQGAPYAPLSETLPAFCVRDVDVSFLDRALKPNLESRRQPLIAELNVLAESYKNCRRRLCGLSSQLQSANPSAAAFPRDMVRIMKSFSIFLGEEKKTIDPALSLCSRSTMTILGGIGQSSLLGGNDPKMNQQVLDQCAGFFHDLEKSLQINADCLQETAAKLSIDS